MDYISWQQTVEININNSPEGKWEALRGHLQEVNDQTQGPLKDKGQQRVKALMHFMDRLCFTDNTLKCLGQMQQPARGINMLRRFG